MNLSISVIIPLYNAEKFISKALDSCIQFTEVKEIIVIDDAYPDNAAKIVFKYVEKDPRVTLLHHPGHKNMGAGASRNLGIKAATQEYIAFLDADDFYLPNRFLKDKEIFVKYPAAAGCYSALGTYFYSEAVKKSFLKSFNGRMVTTVFAETKPSPDNLFEGLLGLHEKYGYFSLDCLTIRREQLIKNDLLFNEALRLHQDTDFIIRLSYYCRLYPSSINDPVALRGVHDENRIMANYKDEIKEQNFKQFLLWESLFMWAKEENLKNKNLKIYHWLKDNYDYYRMILKERPNLFTLIKEILTNYDILKSKHYRKIHRLFTRSLGDRVSFGLLRVKNIFYISRV